MALAVIVATLLTACCVILALLLDAHAGRWTAPVVFGLGVFTVMFYGWAIYSTVHPSPAVRSRVPNDPADSTELGGGASDGPSAQ
jgi:hypothetical protein